MESRENPGATKNAAGSVRNAKGSLNSIFRGAIYHRAARIEAAHPLLRETIFRSLLAEAAKASAITGDEIRRLDWIG